MNISERIREVRGDLSQKEFAQKIGVNMNTLRAYEKGRSLPSSEVLSSVCLNFDVNPEWLLLGVVTDRSTQSESETKSPRQCQRCDFLEQELAQERQERRELSQENRKLWKENGELKAELATLKAEARATTSAEATRRSA